MLPLHQGPSKLENAITNCACVICANARGWKGQTALHLIDELAFVHMLLELKANIDAQDDDGNPPLITQTRSGNQAIVLALLAYGANTEIKNKAGETCLDVPKPPVSAASSTAQSVSVGASSGTATAVPAALVIPPLAEACRCSPVAGFGDSLKVGDNLDCFDTEHKWRLAEIMRISERAVFVHYCGWPEVCSSLHVVCLRVLA